MKRINKFLYTIHKKCFNISLLFVLLIFVLSGCNKKNDVELLNIKINDNLDANVKELKDLSDEGRSIFQITILDVGQGDATFVECDGHYMLIDGGPVSASSTIYSFLDTKGIDHLDYIINTHPDDDHIGGLSAALNRVTVDRAFAPYKKDSIAYDNFVKYLSQVDVNVEYPKIGTVLELGDAIAEIISCNLGSDNNSSIVIRIKFENNSFLFMGDAEEDVENYLISSNVEIKSDLLKVAHHGSKYSTTESFLEKVSPDYAIISVGKDNTYGHPSEEVVLRLSTFNVKIYRTDLNGDILIVSDGENIEISTEKSKRPSIENEKKVDEENSGYSKVVRNNENKELYVLNTNSRKFHYSWCTSVDEMSEKNKQICNLDRDEIIEMGYVPCKRCNP